MKKSLILGCAAAVALSVVSCNNKMEKPNPFLQEYTTQFELPPFEDIQVEHYIPALNEGIKQHNEEIAAIIANPEAPTFDNTILALENSGAILDRVMGVFAHLAEADNTPELEALSEEMFGSYSKHSDEVMMNDALFQRVKALYDDRDNQDYTVAQKRLIEKYYEGFARNGALLNDEDKAKLSALNDKLTGLYIDYNRNLLNATNDFAIVVENEAELDGVPASVVAVAAEEAQKRGLEGKWVLTMHNPVRLPVLQYANNRDLREKMYRGYTEQASSGQYDNAPVIKEILRTRTAKAKLLGYPTFAAYMTENVMAKTPEAAEGLLMKIWGPATDRAREEVAEMQAYVNAQGGNFTIEPWDYYYYVDKVRQQKYNFDESEVMPYFTADNVRNGIFEMANRLYGVTFKEIPDAPKYHPDVTVYEVLDQDNNHVAVFMTDYFTRPSKRQGAWMEELKTSWVNPDGSVSRPIVYNVCNFAKPSADTPSLLTIDDVETAFHEFGHGLHGMLSRAQYKGQSGTSVDRDFVELPSQIHEHWAFNPELLKVYAKHYQTGEVIPDSLIQKMDAASKHGQGFTTTELAGAALLDLKWGQKNLEEGEDVDVYAFEDNVAKELNMPKEITFRYRSPYFKHIFGSDGYASGYYTYLWAEVLDSDGFELFEEKGVFDPETAASFKKNILEMGGSEDPMKLFVTFRGHEPNPDALLRSRGLTPAKKTEKNSPKKQKPQKDEFDQFWDDILSGLPL